MRPLLRAVAAFAAGGSALHFPKVESEAPAAPEALDRCDFTRCPWSYDAVQEELLEARRRDPSWDEVASTALEEAGGEPLRIAMCQIEPCMVETRYPRSELLRVASNGILFVGDSTARRLFIRLVSRLEGLTDHQSEMLQISAKDSKDSTPQVDIGPVDNLREHGEPKYSYRERGWKAAYEASFKLKSGSIAGIFRDTPDYHTVVLGIPLAHMLHHPQYNKESWICRNGGGNFSEFLIDRVSSVLRLFRESFPARRLVLLDGIAYGRTTTPQELTDDHGQDEICPQCLESKCFLWMQTNDGMQRANHLVRIAAIEQDVLLVDLYRSAIGQVKHSIDRRVHYTHPVLDDQLAHIFAAVP